MCLYIIYEDFFDTFGTELVSDTLATQFSVQPCMKIRPRCTSLNYHNKSLLDTAYYSEYSQYSSCRYSITDFSYCGLEFLGARLYLTLLLQIVVKILLRCLFCQYIYPLLERQRATNWFQSLYTTLYSSDLALEVRKHVVSIFL